MPGELLAPLTAPSPLLAPMQVLQPLGMVGVAVVVLAKARSRRGGGDASDFGLGGGGRGGLAGDPRLREFERLLQVGMGTVTACSNRLFWQLSSSGRAGGRLGWICLHALAHGARPCAPECGWGCCGAIYKPGVQGPSWVQGAGP